MQTHTRTIGVLRNCEKCFAHRPMDRAVIESRASFQTYMCNIFLKEKYSVLMLIASRFFLWLEKWKLRLFKTTVVVWDGLDTFYVIRSIWWLCGKARKFLSIYAHMMWKWYKQDDYTSIKRWCMFEEML